ncbi:MAG: hypothetical protein ACE5DI_04600 [Candidatus Micrarchaeia archaeon]
MSEHVFSIPSSSVKELKKVLSADSMAENSFARVGYALREAKALGLEGDRQLLLFSCEDEQKAKSLVERLTQVPEAEELTEKDKREAVKKFNEEGQDAAEGFGSIFS